MFLIQYKSNNKVSYKRKGKNKQQVVINSPQEMSM